MSPPDAGLRLYTYFRSSAAFRVRIALNLKGLAYQAVPVHLLRDGGEQHSAAHAARYPAELIPVLETGQFTLGQSLAIIEYLEQRYPLPPLLPAQPEARAKVRALALMVAADIHPLCNLRALQYLKRLGIEPEARRQWSQHWIMTGLLAIERQLLADRSNGLYCHGDEPTLADCCVVPQIVNALRLECSLSTVPTLARIHEQCMRLPAFQLAAPDRQPDAE